MGNPGAFSMLTLLMSKVTREELTQVMGAPSHDMASWVIINHCNFPLWLVMANNGNYNKWLVMANKWL